MGTIARGTKTATGTINFGANTIAKAAEINTDLNTLYTEVNGLLDENNVDLSAISTTVGFTGQFTAASLTTDNLKVVALSSYASNALAIAGGLTIGQVYRFGDYLGIVH